MRKIPEKTTAMNSATTMEIHTPSISQIMGSDRTHKCDAQNGEDQKKRHNQVDRREGSLSCKIEYKESIHNTIDRSIDHHADRRQGKPDQTAVGKVIR